MKVVSIKAFRMLQPFRVPLPGRLPGRSVEGFDAVIVRMDTDDGLTGWGEMSPLGTFYSPAFAAGARAGMHELAPHLLGMDPREVAHINRYLDGVFNGHPYIKSPLDMACHDLAARAAAVPLVTFLGGKEGDLVDLYKVIMAGDSTTAASQARDIVAQGYRRMQVKVGGNVSDAISRVHAVHDAAPQGTVIFCDANAKWSVFEALQFADATRNIDYVFEQPCKSIAECLAVRLKVDKPMVLDESVTTLHDILEIREKGAADGLTLKISRIGGVYKTRLLRDFAVDLGFMITVEDTGGCEIDTAAMAHLSLSTPLERRLHTSAYQEWVSARTASNASPIVGAKIGIPDGPGLGIDVIPDLLGEPFLDLALLR